MSSVDAPIHVGPESVLIATDFSEASQKPLRHALSIARHFSAKFYLVHVVSHTGYTIAGPEAVQLVVESTRRDAQRLEQDLLASGALAGLPHEFIVLEGNVWEQLELVIRQKHVDLVVLGTHGRGALGKLLLGSVAEQIFRQADCLVVTVGPRSYEDPLVENPPPERPFLFATDFGPASLHALTPALSFANHFGAKLVVLHVLPAAPVPGTFHWSTTGDLAQMRDAARIESQKHFEELNLSNFRMAIQPEFMVAFGILSEQILHAAHVLNAGLIVLGLDRRTNPETSSHSPWDAAYKIVCGARCPVLTARNCR